jgi:hypothetical protein
VRPLLLLVLLPLAASAADMRPDWAERGSGEFTLAGKPKRLYGVGSLGGVRNRALAVAEADSRAHGEVRKLLEARGVAADEARRLAKERDVILDHWKDPADGTMYSLVSFDPGEAAAAASPSPATAAPAPAPGAAELRRMVEEAVRQAQQRPAAPELRSDVDAPTYKRPERPDDFALVVGAEKYALGLPDAEFAERDALAMRDHLLALGYPARNVVLLTGAKASRAGLAKNLEAFLARNVNERSSIFFYFSGHGAPDPRTGDAYLVPTDGDPQYLEETAYPVKRLYQRLDALKARTVIVALDACFSGSGGRSVLAKGTRPLVSKIRLGLEGGRVLSLTASGPSQVSGTLDEQGHGLFTYYLLKGLNGAAADANGRVTSRGLHGYLAPKVQDEAQRQNREQTPQIGGPDTVLR